MNVLEYFFDRAEIGRAVEARISIQTIPLEESIQIGLDVPLSMLDIPIVLRKALSTSITLQWLSSADVSKMTSQIAFVVERARTVLASISNLQMNSTVMKLKTSLCLK